MLLGWLQLVLIIAAAGALAGALLSALGLRLGRERLGSMTPRHRFALLAGLSLFPLVAGVTAVAVVFAPSFLDALGWVPDHCADHRGHPFHLCFVHGPPPRISPLILGSGLAAVLWLLAGWIGVIARVRRAQSFVAGLARLARFDAGVSGWTVESERPLAITAGLFRPEIYVSEGMRGLLSSRQLEAVLAHERAHARRFDALIKLLARFGAVLQLPGVKARLLDELDLACEQACDEAAADHVGDRLTIAETLLTVRCAHAAGWAPPTALGFGRCALERRIRGLLDADWRAARWMPMTAAAAIAMSGIGASYSAIHHSTETLLALLF